ncbi:MAG: hypothetical protein KOO60_04265 [Gemmatimonadales bacterium]|nr:hypothetical protein [Gemmatimonadales bacterium]
MMRACPSLRPLPFHFLNLLLNLVLTLILIQICPGSAMAVSPDSGEDVLPLEREFHLLEAGSSPLTLAHGFIDVGSLQLYVEGRKWAPEEDFRLQGRSGRILPLGNWNRNAAYDSLSGLQGLDSRVLAIVSYRFKPIPLPARLDLRPISSPPVPDSHLSGKRSPLAQVRPVSGELDGLSVRGSKSVQVSSGSRREMSVDQNLRLDISGNLTPEISVRAFLTDDNLPVVPEGNTEQLRDIDKVLVELMAPTWQATLGDFVARRSGTAFGGYRRKLQGISVQAGGGPVGVEVLAGSPRGRYRTFQVRGQESNQGPYYLGTDAGSGNLFIVAGSERVYLDGTHLVRGSDRDYVIDYVRGTITFSYRRLITSESNIVVEFEEGEGPYSRTVVGAGSSANIQIPGLGGSAFLRARIIREKDDPGRLRTGELAEEDEAILGSAGDDPILAVASGVTMVEPGTGLYILSVAGSDTFYTYQEGGDYDLAFFYTGSGQGDYDLDRLDSIGRRIHIYRGVGLGAYRIGRPLARPEGQSLATFTASLGDSVGTYLAAEWNLAQHDLNLLSIQDDHDNAGAAGRIAGRLAEKSIGLGGFNLGKMGLAGFHEARQDRFRPFQIRKNRFHYDAWGLADRARGEGFLEESDRESGLEANWEIGDQEQRISVEGRYGDLEHGESLEAGQSAAEVEWTLFGGQGKHVEQRATASDSVNPLEIERLERIHELNWRAGPVIPSGRYSRREWVDRAKTGSAASGFQLTEMGFGLSNPAKGNLTWRLDFLRALADSLRNENWSGERDSRTLQSGLTTGRFIGMRCVGEGTWRRTLLPGGAEESTRLGRVNLSGNWARTESDWSLGYRLDNSRAMVMDRQVTFVGQQLGDYDQDGQYVGIDRGEYEVVLAATDSLVATTAVQSDLRWRQGFGFLGKERWFSSWSSLTQANLLGRSTTSDIAGLLTMRPETLFDRDATVLTELGFVEEVILLQHRKRIDLRGRFDFSQALDRQYSQHPEDRITRGMIFNGTFNATDRLTVNGRWQRKDERRDSREGLASARRSFSTLTYTTETGGVFRASPTTRLSLQGEYITRRDGVSEVSQREYALRPETRLRVSDRWSLQGQLRVSEVRALDDGAGMRPWFFPSEGRNVESSLRLSWEPTRYLTVAGNWFARKRSDRRWEHDLRLESTARF